MSEDEALVAVRKFAVADSVPLRIVYIFLVGFYPRLARQSVSTDYILSGNVLKLEDYLSFIMVDNMNENTLKTTVW